MPVPGEITRPAQGDVALVAIRRWTANSENRRSTPQASCISSAKMIQQLLCQFHFGIISFPFNGLMSAHF
jgi:hypothetical protein